jgi:hypothetical protein
MGTPQPSYRIVKRDGVFALRAYAPMILAEVQAAGPHGKALMDGKRLLDAYLEGANDQGAALQRLVPITLQPADDRLDGQSWLVRIILPPVEALHQVPRPKDERISIFRVPVARAAVCRFGGRANGRAMQAQAIRLRAWMKKNDLAEAAPPTFAFYDPTWLPGIFRRNEVLIGTEY